jgi:hypothetical protein
MDHGGRRGRAEHPMMDSKRYATEALSLAQIIINDVGQAAARSAAEDA